MSIQFIRENPAVDQFQKTTKFIQGRDAEDFRMDEAQKTQPDRMKMIAGQANTADAQGRVAQATVDENIAQERTATQQGRANLRSTNLMNLNRELDLETDMAKSYQAGLEAEGDNIARKLGKDPASPEIQALKRDRELLGVIITSREAADKQFDRPDHKQQFIAGNIKVLEERRKAGQRGVDPSTPYSDNPAFPPRATQPVNRYGSRGRGALREDELIARLVETGMEKQAATRAVILKQAVPPNQLSLMAKRQVEMELGRDPGYDDGTREERARRFNEVMGELTTRFSGAGASSPGPAPVPSQIVPPPNSGGAPAPAPGAQVGAQVGQQVGRSLSTAAPVPDAGTAPAPAMPPSPGGSPVPSMTQAPGPQLSSPGSRQAPARVASPQDAAKLPAGSYVLTGRGDIAVRVDSEAEAMQQPPNTIVVFPDGRTLRRN